MIISLKNQLAQKNWLIYSKMVQVYIYVYSWKNLISFCIYFKDLNREISRDHLRLKPTFIGSYCINMNTNLIKKINICF